MKMVHLKNIACATVFFSVICIAFSAETTLYDALSKDSELSDVSINVLSYLYFSVLQ